MKLIPTVRLNRQEKSSQGTLEPSDELNERNISSIPAQQYQCMKIHSSQFGETFEIVDVPGRSYVLFHKGNVDDHTKGCVIRGQYFGKLQKNRAVLNSGATFKKFMEIMKDIDKFLLTIKECY